MAKQKGFLDTVARGESPRTSDGFLGQDVNGTVQSNGPGWNRQYRYERFPTEAPTEGPWRKGSNRTGE